MNVGKERLLRADATTSFIKSIVFTERNRHVAITLASIDKAFELIGERVPWVNLRIITQCLKARSASLFVNG